MVTRRATKNVETSAVSTGQAAALSSVFGKKPEGAIFLPDRPFEVRFNCKSGQFAIGDDKFLGNEAEISIIGMRYYFGNLGLTKHSEWVQLFYVPAPKCVASLPRDTVCVSYLKTRSVRSFQTTVAQVIAASANPAEGIFKLRFAKHTGAAGEYFSIVFDWRQREADEVDQLHQIVAFMSSDPGLADIQGTKNMVDVSGISSMLVQQMIELGQRQPDLSPREIYEGIVNPNDALAVL